MAMYRLFVFLMALLLSKFLGCRAHTFGDTSFFVAYDSATTQ